MYNPRRLKQNHTNTDGFPIPNSPSILNSCFQNFQDDVQHLSKQQRYPLSCKTLGVFCRGTWSNRDLFNHMNFFQQETIPPWGFHPVHQTVSHLFCYKMWQRQQFLPFYWLLAWRERFWLSILIHLEDLPWSNSKQKDIMYLICFLNTWAFQFYIKTTNKKVFICLILTLHYISAKIKLNPW